MFLQRKGWKEVGTAPWDKADKWKMQLQIYLIENVLGSLSWATAQASHTHMRCRKGEAVHALQTICCHHYKPMSFLHIFGCDSGLKYCLKQQCDLYNFLSICACLWPLKMFFNTLTQFDIMMYLFENAISYWSYGWTEWWVKSEQ